MNDFGQSGDIINVRSTIVKMKCGDRRSCEDEIKSYADELHMPDNHNFRMKKTLFDIKICAEVRIIKWANC